MYHDGGYQTHVFEARGGGAILVEFRGKHVIPQWHRHTSSDPYDTLFILARKAHHVRFKVMIAKEVLLKRAPANERIYVFCRT